MFSYFAIACLLGVAAAAPSGIGPIAVGAIDSVSIPRYGFNYAVSDPLTGDNKAQTESRDGGVVRGSYSLTEPDGTLRVVNYAADPVSGFNAVVKRVGPAAHPQSHIQPIVTKQIVAPVAAPVVAPIATAPIFPTSVVGLGGLGNIGGHGIGKLGLGSGIGLGYGDLGGLGAHGAGIGLGHGNLAGLGAHGAGIGLGYGNLGGLGAHGSSIGLGYGYLGGLGAHGAGMGLGYDNLGGLGHGLGGGWKH